MSESTIDRSLVSDQVFRVLCEAILSGRYAPGEKLPTQRRLAAELGVNLAPVREAIKRLEQLRLLEVRHGDAMRVRDWRAHGALDVLGHAIFSGAGLDRATLGAVLEARTAMLAEVARLAAQRRSESQVQRLNEIAAELALAEDAEAAQALDFAYFAELIDAAGNIVFVLIMNTLRELYFAHAELFRAVVEEHLALVPLYERAASAVAEHDPAGAFAAVAELAGLQQARLQERMA
jgi:GntR family transcriptional regulator, transcriptional repressor for pyruvate dehydrogenase complex